MTIELRIKLDVNEISQPLVKIDLVESILGKESIEPIWHSTIAEYINDCHPDLKPLLDPDYEDEAGVLLRELIAKYATPDEWFALGRDSDPELPERVTSRIPAQEQQELARLYLLVRSNDGKVRTRSDIVEAFLTEIAQRVERLLHESMLRLAARPQQNPKPPLTNLADTVGVGTIEIDTGSEIGCCDWIAANMDEDGIIFDRA